ncbi:MAG: acetyltransferase [Gemmatimonadetes bacterium]|nr:acetyltransferase [Gemmatimonadota bacterium]
MKPRIVIVGGGGHAKVLCDLIACTDGFEVVGLVDPALPAGSRQFGLPVLGDDSILEEVLASGVGNATVGLGGTGNNRPRKRLFDIVESTGFSLPSLVHPSAVVSEQAELGEGAQVMAGVIVQTGSLIGKNTILNTGSCVDHDTKVGNHVHLAPAAALCGGCTVGDLAHVGAGAVVIQDIRVGSGSIVAAGATVVRDVPDGTTVAGTPARAIPSSRDRVDS